MDLFSMTFIYSEEFFLISTKINEATNRPCMRSVVVWTYLLIYESIRLISAQLTDHQDMSSTFLKSYLVQLVIALLNQQFELTREKAFLVSFICQ